MSLSLAKYHQVRTVTACRGDESKEFGESSASEEVQSVVNMKGDKRKGPEGIEWREKHSWQKISKCLDEKVIVAKELYSCQVKEAMNVEVEWLQRLEDANYEEASHDLREWRHELR